MPSPCLAQSSLNLLTVNETAPEPVPEDRDNINGVQQLSLEATAVNQNFSQQVRRLKEGYASIAGRFVVLRAHGHCMLCMATAMSCRKRSSLLL